MFRVTLNLRDAIRRETVAFSSFTHSLSLSIYDCSLRDFERLHYMLRLHSR